MHQYPPATSVERGKVPLVLLIRPELLHGWVRPDHHAPTAWSGLEGCPRDEGAPLSGLAFPRDLTESQAPFPPDW